MAATTVALGPFLTRKLREVLGGREQRIEGNTMRWIDEDGVVLVEGDLEPLQVFRPGPAIEMASGLGALGVVSVEDDASDATAFHALITLRPVQLPSPEERDDNARLFAGVALLKLADHIADEVRRNEGHPPRTLHRDLVEQAAFFRALSEHVVRDLPVAASFLGVAAEIEAYAPRAAHQGEALRIATELRAKSHLWRSLRSSN
jgi:hypothetical protein